MKLRTRLPIARNIDSAILAEIFFVNAILSIIAIRVFLSLTDYPQLGGGDLHIAHMLWGGMLMFSSICITLFTIGKSGLYISAILGGLGFGTFIDELGKFITSDNDYFFRPTIAIIYILFVMLFFLFRYFFINKSLTSREYLINAADFLKEIIITEDYDKDDELKLEYMLNQGKAGDSLTQQFRQIALMYKTNGKSKLNRYLVLKRFLKDIFLKMIHTPKFRELLNAIFIFRTFLILGTVITNLVIYSEQNLLTPDFFEIGIITSALLTNATAIIAMRRFKIDKFRRLNWFRYSTLYSILFYSFFAFYYNQLGAILGLGFDILLYYAIDIILSIENRQKKNPLFI